MYVYTSAAKHLQTDCGLKKETTRVIVSFPFSQLGECHEIQRRDHDPAPHQDNTTNLQIRSQHQEIRADLGFPEAARRERGRRERMLVAPTEVGLSEWPVRIGWDHFATITNDALLFYDVHGILHWCNNSIWVWYSFVGVFLFCCCCCCCWIVFRFLSYCIQPII